MDWQHRLAPLPGHAYLHELLSIDVDGEEIRSRWSGTHAAAAEMAITLDEPVDPVALVAAHDVMGRFVELQFTAPASISAVWGLHHDLRTQLVDAHLRAVDEALGYLGLAISAVPIVAHFPHTTAWLPRPEGTPPPQLHTHALLVAVDMDQPADELVTFGGPDQVSPARARLGYVPDGLDRIVGEIDARYRSAIADRVGALGFRTDAQAEIPDVFVRLAPQGYWMARPCGIGFPGAAVAFE